MSARAAGPPAQQFECWAAEACSAEAMSAGVLTAEEQYYVFETVALPDMPADCEDWDDCRYLAHFNELRGRMVAFLGGT